MATVAQFNQDPNNPQQGGGGQVLNSTGSSGDTSGGAGGAPQTPYNAPRAQLGGGTNIQQYLQANQGAGQKLASTIQGSVQNQANKIDQNVNTSQNQLQNAYQPLQQTEEQGQQTIQTAFQDPQKLLNAYQASQNQASNQALTADQQQALQQYNQFQSYNNPNAGGGLNSQISNYGNQASQAQANLQAQQQNLQQQANSAATESGRFGLLRNAIGQPNYSTGQQSLDALFLQAQPGVANQLKQNLTGVADQTGQNIQGMGADTASKIAALQSLSGQNQQFLQNQFGSGLSDIAQNVGNEYAGLQTSAPAQQAAITQAFQNNQFTPDQLSKLGLTANMQTWGLNPQQLMAAGGLSNNTLLAADQGGNAQAATPEEFARYNALNQLAGGGPNQQLQSSIFGSATQAGGYNPVSFNTNSLQSAIDARKQAVTQSDLQNALTTIGGGSRQVIPQIQAGLQSGVMTPQMANDLIQGRYRTELNAYHNAEDNGGASVNWNAVNAEMTPWNNYYNQEYLPASQAQLGGTAEQIPGLPGQNVGNIDWSQIGKPQGK